MATRRRTASSQRQEELADRVDEVERRLMASDLTVFKRVALEACLQSVAHRLVRPGYALWLASAARCVEDVCKARRTDGGGRAGFRQLVGHVVRVAHLKHATTKPCGNVDSGLDGKEQRDGAVVGHVTQARHRVARIQRHVWPASLKHAEQSGHAGIAWRCTQANRRIVRCGSSANASS